MIKVKTYVFRDHPNWLSDLARGYAAGGECSRNLTTTDYGGDTIDRRLWGETCLDSYKESDRTQDEISIITESLWVEAQKDVRRKLKDSETLVAAVRNKAKEIMPLLFPWTKHA